MQKIRDIVDYFKSELSDIYSYRENISLAYIVIEDIFGYNRSESIINANKEIRLNEIKKINNIIFELKNNKPIQYILGSTNFYGIKIKVNENTLIPRPETEELVDWILKDDFNSMLDIGTGTGCIPIAIAKNKDVKIYALDKSKNALKIAKENSRINNVNINFIEVDIFKFNESLNFDLIVSNPPYILKSKIDSMSSNVVDYEPHEALFVNDKDPLVFFKQISKIAIQMLNSNGKLYFEINEDYATEIKLILNEFGFVDIQLKNDINDRNRMLRAIKK